MTQVSRTAVVGGGIFGVTAAVQLARAGHSVVLFESAAELLSGASRANQRRLQRGYHYPRGMETATAALRSVKAFEAEYSQAVYGTCAHYVAISRRDSLVTADQYTAFCAAAGLRYREEYPRFLRRDSVDVCLRIDESLIDIKVLRRLCTTKLAASSVTVALGTRADREMLRDFDHVVLAAYASLSQLQTELRCPPNVYHYEVCEKPVVRLPRVYRNTSLVIMDGPFMCLDPVAGTEEFLLGNVDHAIHATTVGYFPLIPKRVLPYLDRGVVAAPEVTRFPQFVAFAREFLIGFDGAEHLGSMFTTRAVLPNYEATDDRPTLVRRVDERTVAIFGGKITTCVDASREVAAMLSPTAIPMHREAIR